MKGFNPTLSSVSKVFCNLFGHKLLVSKNVTNHIHEYKCARCSMEMTDTAQGFLARLTPKFKETNDYLAQVHQRRKHRQFINAT